MLLVRTEVKPSKVHGLGLFAAEPIKAGTVLRRYDPRFDREFTKAQLQELPELARAFLEHFGYEADGDGIKVSMDNSRYTNHSKENPNVVWEGDVTTALRDIAVGEEILEDYLTYEPDFRMPRP